MVIIIYILAGFLPSIIWLYFYYKRDVDKEPKKAVLKAYIFGAIFTIPAILIEFILYNFMASLFTLSQLTYSLITAVAIAPPVEEYIKYLSMKTSSLSKSYFDEPSDAIIYMVTAAMGFAGIENALQITILASSEGYNAASLLLVNIARTLGPVFLHSVASGIFGYFIALSLYYPKKKAYIFLTGFAIATIIHLLFNLSVYLINNFYLEATYFIGTILIMLLLAILLLKRIEVLNKLNGICKIKINNK